MGPTTGVRIGSAEVRFVADHVCHTVVGVRLGTRRSAAFRATRRPSAVWLRLACFAFAGAGVPAWSSDVAVVGAFCFLAWLMCRFRSAWVWCLALFVFCRFDATCGYPGEGPDQDDCWRVCSLNVTSFGGKRDRIVAQAVGGPEVLVMQESHHRVGDDARFRGGLTAAGLVGVFGSPVPGVGGGGTGGVAFLGPCGSILPMVVGGDVVRGSNRWGACMVSPAWSGLGRAVIVVSVYGVVGGGQVPARRCGDS